MRKRKTPTPRRAARGQQARRWARPPGTPARAQRRRSMRQGPCASAGRAARRRGSPRRGARGAAPTRAAAAYIRDGLDSSAENRNSAAGRRSAASKAVETSTGGGGGGRDKGAPPPLPSAAAGAGAAAAAALFRMPRPSLRRRFSCTSRTRLRLRMSRGRRSSSASAEGGDAGACRSSPPGHDHPTAAALAPEEAAAANAAAADAPRRRRLLARCPWLLGALAINARASSVRLGARSLKEVPAAAALTRRRSCERRAARGGEGCRRAATRNLVWPRTLAIRCIIACALDCGTRCFQ